MGFLADLLIRIGGDATDLKKELSGARRDLQSWGRDLSALGRTMTAAVTLPIMGVAAAAVKMAGDLEQNSVAFKTMMGSADAAQKHLTELRDFALKTPFQFNDLVLASKRMQALGFEAKSVLPALRNIGDAAAALGMGSEGIMRIVTALGQMKAKGAVQAEEMRQLAEAGIPAWEILAKTLNTTVADAMKQVEKRAVDAGTAVPAILAGINEKFGGLMEQQSKTLLGQMSNFKDAITFTLQDLGKTLAPTAKGLLENVLQPMLNTVKDLAAAFAAMPPGVQQTVIAFGAITAAVGPLGWALGGIATGFSNIISLALKLPALLNPVVLGILAIGTAAGIAFWELNRSTAKMSSLDKDFSEWISKRIKETKDFAATREMLDQALEKGAIGASEYQQALALLSEREKQAFGSEAKAMFADLGVTLSVTVPKAAGAAKVSIEELAKAQNRHLDAIEEMGKRYETFWKDVDRIYKQLIAGDEELARSYLYGKAVFSATHDAMARKANEAVAIIVPLYERIGEAWRNAMSVNAAYAVGQYSGAANRQAEIAKSGWPETLKGMKPAFEQARHQMSIFDREARRMMDHMAGGIARAVVQWKDFGKTIADTGKSIAMAIGEYMVKQGIARLILSMDGLMKHLGAIGKALTGWATEITGATKKATEAIKQTSAAAEHAGHVMGGSPSTSATKAPSGSGGGGAAGAAGGWMGWANMISGAATAVSSVIGNFQMAGMNKTLDLLEKSMRFLDINFAAFYQTALTYLPNLQSINEAIYTHIMPAFAELIAANQAGAGGSEKIEVHVYLDSRELTGSQVRTMRRVGILPASI